MSELKSIYELIKEFLVDLKSIPIRINKYKAIWVNDDKNKVADGNKLEEIIQKWKRRLKDGS